MDGMVEMRQAVLIRPQWRDAPDGPPRDPRLLLAPLQYLTCRMPDPSVVQAFAAAESPWIVFTSPASVQAYARWSDAHNIRWLCDPWVRIAAVGSGTRDELVRVNEARKAKTQTAWSCAAENVLVSAADEKADAVSLLAAFDAEHDRVPFEWSAQTLFLVQAVEHRPTLRNGLTDRGARVVETVLYERQDVVWDESVWERLRACPWSDTGIVVTSSGLVDTLAAMFRAHRVPIGQLIWCTHHATIAQRLQAIGLASVRRVRLSPEHLTLDLFEHEILW